MSSSTQRRLSLSIELLLWVMAAACFGFMAWERTLAMQADRESKRLVAPASPHSEDSEGGKASPKSAPGRGEVIGRLRIDVLGVSVPIIAGVESTSLLRGVGHIEGTASAGGLGTLALAGHRDTYLRPLERVAKNMDVQVSDRSGTYHYRVDSWEIVTPDQVDVLSVRNEPELVLITCYPFHYVGSAPERFVVHAHLLSLTPDLSSPGVPRGSGLH